MKLKIISLLFSLFFSAVADAQTDKIETDRPDQTETPFTTPKKWVQLEMGFNSQCNKPGSNEFFSPALLSKYGISNKIELRVITTIQTNSFILIPQGTTYLTGLVPVEIGGKISFWEEKKWVPKTSLIFHFVIPKLASKKFQANKLAPNFRFTMQNSLSKNIALGYNLGAEWDGFTNEPTWIYTFAPGFNLSEKWYCYIEAFGFITKEDAPQHSLDGGIAYFLNNNLKVDFSAGFGITETAPDYYFAIGASLRFKAAK
jgi:Putative MetA-pathway of phenol degradation